MPNKFINKLEGKRVLVFGGSSGIGFAVVEAALEFGATVFISGSNLPKLERTVERLTTSYPELPKDRIHIHACNLADAVNAESNIKSLFDAATDGGKTKLNHIVHTAGDSLKLVAVSEVTTEKLHESMQVRLMTSVFIAKLSPQYLETSADSSITWTSGVNTVKPGRTWSVMTISGGSLEAFTAGAAVDLAPVRVNCVSPGAIKTELFAGLTPEAEATYMEKTLVHRLGRPEDCAEAYLYSMKDGFATGQVINSNGGYVLV